MCVAARDDGSRERGESEQKNRLWLTLEQSGPGLPSLPPVTYFGPSQKITEGHRRWASPGHAVQVDARGGARGRRPRPRPPSIRSPLAMDRLESLGNALSQITMYDIKSMVNQVCGSAAFWACVRYSSRVGQECRIQRE